jgi:hypothetical protein
MLFQNFLKVEQKKHETENEFLFCTQEVAAQNRARKTKFRLWNFVVLLSPSRQIPVEYLRINYDRFVPQPSQFIKRHAI